MSRMCTAVVAACGLFLLGSLRAPAQERPPAAPTPASTPEELKKLKRQLEALKKEHASRIATLEQQIRKLQTPAEQEPPREAAPTTEEAELAVLRSLAEEEAAREPAPTDPVTVEETTTFKIGGLSLQSLNPEISVVGDFLGRYRFQDGTKERADFEVRTLGLHLEAYLDPYTRMKAAIPVTEKFAKLGEAYVTRFGVLPEVNLTAGKFRQPFGVVNRWHKHGLDQVDFPLALREIFGDGGLNQTGLSADWQLPPLGEAAQALQIQITNGENERLFSGNTVSTPSALAHYKLFHDLTSSLYVEGGLSALVGWNDEWDVQQGTGLVTEDATLPTRVFGADLTLVWEPADRMRYRNVEWRSELYILNRDLLAPDTGQRDTIRAWGAYSYVQSRLARQWIAGVRFDYYKPDAKPYAGLVPSMDGLVAANNAAFRWGASPYVTWEQSPFVRLRLEYDYTGGKGMERPEHQLILQIIFAAGPHKHDRY